MAVKDCDTRRLDTPTSDESGTGDATPKSSEPEADLVVPPDGGWGWVVVAASFVCNMLVDGIIFSSGLLLEPIASEFKVGHSQVALVSSLLSGFYLVAGPFVSALANRYGFRVVCVAGAVLGAGAFGLSYFATSVEFLCFSYGVVGGLGFCLIYMPAVIAVGFYFERWRALATGLSMCGSGVGTFVFAPLTTSLLQSIQWRATILVHGGLILICMVCGAMFRPVKPMHVTLAESLEGDDEKSKEQETSEKDHLAFMMKLKLKVESGLSLPAEMRLQPLSSPHTWMGVASNRCYPTTAEIFKGSQTNLTRRLSATSAGKGQINPKYPRYLAVPVVEKAETINEASNENVKSEKTDPLLDGLDESEMCDANWRRHTVSGRSNQQNKSKKTVVVTEPVVRPFYRDDIFFEGSLQRLPKYMSQSSIAYHMSVTHVPTKEDVIEETKCKICPEAVKRTLATMLDTSLLKSPSFMLLAVSGFFTMMGFFIPFMYVTARALAGGMDGAFAVWLVSTIGIANTLGRVLCGLLSSFDRVSTLWINNLALTVGGVATILSGFSLNLGYQFTYSAIFGLSIACFASLRSILVVELMGLEKLTNAFGLLMLFQGIAACIGAPIAGIFMDATGGYDASFYLSGCLITLSALLCYPLNIISSWEKRRAKELKLPAVV